MLITDLYEVVNHPQKNYDAVRLTEMSKWPGFIYRYDQVSFDFDEEVENSVDDKHPAKLSFQYIVEDMGKTDVDENDEELQKLIGEILIDLLKTAINLKDGIEYVGKEN